MESNKKPFTRRQFVRTTSVGAIAASQFIPAFAIGSGGNKASGKLAALGGTPVRSNKKWPDWPYSDQEIIDSVL
jgi:hypothetical protein